MKNVEWYKNITTPVICWVSDKDIKTTKYIDIIDECYEGLFYSSSEDDDLDWKFAEPVTAEDLEQHDVEWFNDINKPVMCWVSNEDLNEKKYVELVTRYYNKSGEFTSIQGNDWKFATPVTSDTFLK